MRIAKALNHALFLVLVSTISGVGCGVSNKDIQTALEESRNAAVKKRGDTELHIAAAQGDSSAASKLISRGTDLNVINNNGQTPLMLAIHQDKPATAKILIIQGAKIDLADNQGNTALHLATQNGQPEVVQALLNRGADPNRLNKARETPLLLATKADYPEIVLLLLERKADSNVVDGDKLTPLHYATNWHQTIIVQRLIEQGLNPDLRGPNGQTPLMIAAYFGDLPTTSILLRKGAQKDQRDDKGQTSLHIAAQNGHKNVVAVLLDEGADINAQTKSGHTAMLLGAKNDHADMVKYLVSRGATFIALEDTPRNTFASALVAQRVAEEAQSSGEISRAREFYKLASGCFEKAAVAYQNAAETVITKQMIATIAESFVLSTQTLALASFNPQNAMQGQLTHEQRRQTKLAAQSADLEAAAEKDKGHYGYFSELVKYEESLSRSLQKDSADFENLHNLYSRIAQQARDYAQRNATYLSPP